MKIVFVGSLKSQSASSAQRLWALQQCNEEVFVIDRSKHAPKLGRYAGYAAKILKHPGLMYNVTAIGKHLIELCESVKPDLVWIEWATDLEPEVLMRIKNLDPRPLLVSLQDDNPWGERHGDAWIWKKYFKIAHLFDLHLVKRNSDVKNLQALGAKQCRLWRHGVYSPLFHPPVVPVPKKYPVSFVGTCIDGRAKLVEYLLVNKIPVHVFGNRWVQRSNLPQRFPANFHPAAEGEAYVNVIHQSQICLGLVSHSHNDEWTMRTYEVPGCAGLLLAERTAVHEELFAEDVEAAFFSDPKDCLLKLQTLLLNPIQCEAKGKAAYIKFINNGWMLEDEMKELLAEIKVKYLPVELIFNN